MARFNNMAFVTVAGKRQVRVNVSGKSMFFFDLPVWANHVAIDACGEVFAFERQPIQNPSLASWDSHPGRLSCLGNVGFINNWKEAYIAASSAAKEFDAFATCGFATGGFVKGDQLTVNADEVKAMVGKDGTFKVMPDMTGMTFIGDALIARGSINLASFKQSADKDSGQCKIEDMPIAAKVMAVKDAYENWVDFYYVQNGIEIHDDTVTLLNRKRGFTAEVSFKRGTMVKWEK